MTTKEQGKDRGYEQEIAQFRKEIISLINNTLGERTFSPWADVAGNYSFRFARLSNEAGDVIAWLVEEHDHFLLPGGFDTANRFETDVLYRDERGRAYGTSAPEIWVYKPTLMSAYDYHREKVAKGESSTPLTWGDYKRLKMSVSMLAPLIMNAIVKEN